MNRKVFITLLSLTCAYLGAYYVLKFAFPEQFLLSLTGSGLAKFGEFLQTHKVINEIISNLMTILTFYLFSCACSSKLYLSWKETICVILLAIATNYSYVLIPQYSVHVSTTAMLLSATICRGKLLNTTITFGVHGTAQLFLLNIRGIETVLPKLNQASVYALGLEGLVILILFYIIFNFKKKEKKYE